MCPIPFRELLTKSPFSPFVIVTNSGDCNELVHLQFTLLDSGGMLHLSKPDKTREGFLEPPTCISVYHIAAIDRPAEKAA